MENGFFCFRINDMNRQLNSFVNDSFALRVVDVDGSPWFVAADVCKALDISNSRDAISRLDEDEKGVATTDTLGGVQQVSIVSESGMYALIFSSRKPEARAFRKWVTSEVLPSIRKTGSYSKAGHNPGLGRFSASALDAVRRVSKDAAGQYLAAFGIDAFPQKTPESRMEEEAELAALLLAWLEKRHGATATEIIQRGPSPLRSAKARDAALGKLVDEGKVVEHPARHWNASL